LDSLRYDSAIQAENKCFNKIISKYQEKYNSWVKVYSHGTYTFPVHSNLFYAGVTPDNPKIKDQPFCNRPRIFKMYIDKLGSKKEAVYNLPESKNIVKSFEKIGYKTIGIGGVSWLRNDVETSKIWLDCFEDYYWSMDYSEINYQGLKDQFKLMNKLNLKQYEKLFFFMNIATTHKPYRGEEESIKGQAKCLDYIDSYIDDIIDLLPKPVDCYIFGDHGDCFGEDGLYYHGFYHPKIMEVPMINLKIN
jgi:hypothetical protein